MKIKIKAFASVGETLGFNERELIVSDGITVKEIMDQLKKTNDSLNSLKERLLFAINEVYCTNDSVLTNEDILAIFPPVSGG